MFVGYLQLYQSDGVIWAQFRHFRRRLVGFFVHLQHLHHNNCSTDCPSNFVLHFGFVLLSMHNGPRFCTTSSRVQFVFVGFRQEVYRPYRANPSTMPVGTDEEHWLRELCAWLLPFFVQNRVNSNAMVQGWQGYEHFLYVCCPANSNRCEFSPRVRVVRR